jgi:hypothetical protein
MNEESRVHLPYTEEAHAALAARSIERALNHQQAPEPASQPQAEVTTLAEMVEIMRGQFAVINARLDDLERRMYMPPDLVEALKNHG